MLHKPRKRLQRSYQTKDKGLLRPFRVSFETTGAGSLLAARKSHGRYVIDNEGGRVEVHKAGKYDSNFLLRGRHYQLLWVPMDEGATHEILDVVEV